jgi:hypothetical protein
MFMFSAAYRLVLWRPIQWVLGLSPRGIKKAKREPEASSSPSAEVRNAWSHTFTYSYVLISYCLIKHRDNFNFYFII